LQGGGIIDGGGRIGRETRRGGQQSIDLDGRRREILATPLQSGTSLL